MYIEKRNQTLRPIKEFEVFIKMSFFVANPVHVKTHKMISKNIPYSLHQEQL